MHVATARRLGVLELLVLIKEVLGACSRSVNLVLGVALFGVRHERGARPDAQAWLSVWLLRSLSRRGLGALALLRDGSANTRGRP
jgi:hypothetical protein